MRNIIYILFLLWSIPGNSQGIEQEYAIDYISAKERLPHNYVSKVVSDSLNVKWIAQETGVTRYDGVNFTKIEPGLKYPGLKNENIETLFLDSKNRLWIGTKSGGISMLDIVTNRLENYNEILVNDFNGILRIVSITEDDTGNMWFGSIHNGLFVFDPEKKKLVQTFNEDEGAIKSLLRDGNGNIWFSSAGMLKKYDTVTKETSEFSFSHVINSFIEDRRRNCLWIATNHSQGDAHKYIFKLDLNTYQIEPITTKINHEYFESIFLDRFNRLWIGTWGDGVYRSNEDVSAFEKVNLVNAQSSSKPINYENIIDIHTDKNNVIWLSTTFAGLVKLTESKGFKNIDATVRNSKIKNELNFQSVYKDKDNIWVGTIQSGLFKGEDFSNLKQVENVLESKVYSITRSGNYMFVGVDKRFYILDTNGKTVYASTIRKVTTTFVDGDKMWLGTQENGLVLFDISDIKNPIRKTIYNIHGDHNKIESNRITSIVKDGNGVLWIGTYNGLHLFDIEKNRFIHQSNYFNGQMPKIINTLYADNANLWVGTPNGLYKLLYANTKLRIEETYNETEGLKSDFICGFSKDNLNNIWLTTPTSLVKFDVEDSSFHHFGKNDGVSTTQFNIRSFYNYNNELILTGGADNLTYFNPSSIINSTEEREIIITRLNVNNRDVSPRDSINDNILLTRDINYTDKITLSHLEKSLFVAFSQNDFRSDIASRYKYRLLGYEEEWVYLNEKNEVNFMGLPPGTYELQLSASNNNKKWLPPRTLKIEVLYAPWSSPLAYGLYFLGLLLVLALITYIVMMELHERNKLKKDQELSEAKFTFFTNISHEFRTPLTLIMSPLKELTQSSEFQGKTGEKLRTMEKNANRLLNLINQLLDFRKAGHGLLKLSVSNGDFARFSNEVFLYFNEAAVKKGISYQFICGPKEIRFPFDRNKMEIVLCNLISNSIKYSMPGSSITLRIDVKDEVCHLSLKDTGYGMDKDSKKKIFDRFYQINSTNTTNIIGSGIGLSFAKKIVELHHGTIQVESKLNKGTEFTIAFPMDSDLYQPSDFSSKGKVISTNLVKKAALIDTEIKDLKVDAKENTVLVVDDNEEIRDYLRQLLSEDYNILTAVDGMDAIEVASKEIPDLILCDIMMPKKDGLAVCKELKEQVNTSHIPILLLTARSSNLYEIQSLETGADDFITKPFDPEIVKARISSALQNRSKLREHFLNKVRFEPTSGPTKSKDPETIFIERVISLVEENLMNETFGIESIMDKMCMSQSTLYRKIKSLTGLSLTGFIRSIRLKKAAEMILTQNEKLSIVALSVGFNDYKYFGENFKKQFGCLPSEYRTMKKPS